MTKIADPFSYVRERDQHKNDSCRRLDTSAAGQQCQWRAAGCLSYATFIIIYFCSVVSRGAGPIIWIITSAQMRIVFVNAERCVCKNKDCPHFS